MPTVQRATERLVIFASEARTMLFLSVTGVNGRLELPRVLEHPFGTYRRSTVSGVGPPPSLSCSLRFSPPFHFSPGFVPSSFLGRLEQLPSRLLLFLSLTRSFSAPPTELERLPQCVSSASCSKSSPGDRPGPGPEPVPPGLGFGQKSLVAPATAPQDYSVR